MNSLQTMKSIVTTEGYDKDELVPPEWLNTTFFEQVLQSPEFDEKNQIKSVSIQPATKKGEHYASIMFRVNALYTLITNDSEEPRIQLNKSFIVKAFPTQESDKQRLLQDSRLFENEIAIYTDVMPLIVKELHMAGETIRFGPRCYHHSLTPQKVLVFEDLTKRDYEIVRDRTLNIDELKMSFRKLAKWHATSFKLAKENPTIFDEYRHNFMTIPYIANGSFIASGIKNFIKMLEFVPTLKVYKPYFERLQPDWTAKCRATYTEYFTNRHPENYYGICHGDFLSNNLMFSHSQYIDLGDVLFVDYQLAYMGPIVNDLIYAFYMIYSAHQRVTNHQELLEYYFKKFSDTLKRLKFQSDSITLEKLQEQIERQKTLALFLLVCLLPIRYAVRAGLVEKDHMMCTDEERGALYYDRNYIAELHKTLPMFISLGYLQ